MPQLIIPKVDNFLAKYYLKSNISSNRSDTDSLLPDTLALDIGCGTCPKNPFAASVVHGIDIRETPDANVFSCDLFTTNPPFADNKYDFITAFDFLEHVPRVLYIDGTIRFRFVEIMSEIFRLLKPGGIFFSFTPAFPSTAAFRDPTHVNIITAETFPMYFCARGGGKRPAASLYGFKDSFDLIAQEMKGDHLLTLLSRPK